MKLIVALGNPGKQYQKNHHNAGFIVIEEFLQRKNLSINKTKFNGIYERTKINGEEVIFAMPHTFMNLSGNFVFSLSNYFGIAPKDILIIHDDKDISLGKYKYKFSGGHAGQNGIRNIIQQLGSKDFSRLRIGIGLNNNKNLDIKNHVLKNFNNSTYQNLLADDSLYESIDFFLANDILETMNKYNE